MRVADSVSLLDQTTDHGRETCWGECGHISALLFELLALFFLETQKGLPKCRRAATWLGMLVIYIAVRMIYDAARLDWRKLEVLAEVSRRLRQRKHAIRIAEKALCTHATRVGIATRVRLLAGLMRDYDAEHLREQSHARGVELLRLWESGVSLPAAKEIYVLFALAWFADAYPHTKQASGDWYIRKAMHVVRG